MNKSHYFSVHCPACAGSFEFPAHGIGQVIECPHCKKQITLAFPPDSENPDRQLKAFLQSVSFPSTEQELFALSLFACPNESSVLAQYSSRLATDEAWSINVIGQFIADGFICDSSNDLTALLKTESSATLKFLAKERGLPHSGSKENLAKKLTENDLEGMRERFHGRRFWACSNKGRILVEKWKEARKYHERLAAIRCHSALLEGHLEEACLEMKEYQDSHQIFLVDGINGDDHEVRRNILIIQTIFSASLPRQKRFSFHLMKEIRVAAAMIHLSGTNNPSEWLSMDAKNCDVNLDLEIRILLFHSLEKLRVSEIKDAGITRVEVLVSNSATVCQICRADSGKIYPIDCAPILPHEGCTCGDGCMCMVIAKE